MNDAQKQTLQTSLSLLHIHSVAAAMAVARRTSIVDQLLVGQKDCPQLAQASGLDQDAVEQLMRVLVAVGFVEKYGDDYALSQAVRLMLSCEPNLGEPQFDQLEAYLRSTLTIGDREGLRKRLVGRQWTQTAAAIQAAEVLEIGIARKGLRVLELGGGAGVWTAAMAYRDPSLSVTSIDDRSSLEIAKQTFEGIGLGDRWSPIEGDYRLFELPLSQFDLVVLAGVVQLEDDPNAVTLLGRATDALREGGEVAIIEPLLESDGPKLAIATHALEISMANPSGKLRSAVQMQKLLRGAGLDDGLWGWLSASPHGIGLVLAKKELSAD